MLKLEAIGFLGKDAVVNQPNGKPVINFSIAHTEKWKDSKGEQQERTTWVECAYWTEKQGIVPYLKKGTQVWVEGVPEVRTYETKDGKSGASLSLRIREIQLLGKGTEIKNSQTPAPQQQQAPAKSDENLDDMPF